MAFDIDTHADFQLQWKLQFKYDIVYSNMLICCSCTFENEGSL
jgi:hypothetical protein